MVQEEFGLVVVVVVVREGDGVSAEVGFVGGEDRCPGCRGTRGSRGGISISELSSSDSRISAWTWRLPEVITALKVTVATVAGPSLAFLLDGNGVGLAGCLLLEFFARLLAASRSAGGLLGASYFVKFSVLWCWRWPRNGRGESERR